MSVIRGNSIHNVSCYTNDIKKRSAFATNIHHNSDDVNEMFTLQTDSISPPPEGFTIRGAAAVTSAALITLFVALEFVLSGCLISLRRTISKINNETNCPSAPSSNHETRSDHPIKTKKALSIHTLLL